MKAILRVALPVVVLALGAGIAAKMIANRPPVQPREPVLLAPLVRVQVVQPTTVSLTVRSQGTVQPRTDIVLVSEVAGTILRVSPALAAGGYFEPDEVLIEIDPRDYELAVIQATARQREAEARLLREEAEAEVARKEWQELGRAGAPSALLLREPQLAEARAAVESAKANVELARRDLEKSKLRAPFAGRVLSKSADRGQFVSRGAQLARIYSIETAEIRLPLAAGELAYVDLPFDYRGEHGGKPEPGVRLTASFAGREHTWLGRVVRTEGEIDARTRMITAVAEVIDPYGRKSDENLPPLAVGLFVSAEIAGRVVPDVFTLPRTALRGGGTLLVVNERDELHSRAVEILRLDRTQVIVSGGLKAGERVCLSPLEAPVDGMKVRIAGAEDADGRAVTWGGAP